MTLVPWMCNPDGSINFKGTIDALSQYHRRLTMAPMPQIDHYYGRSVESIQKEGEGWSLTLEGGIRLINTNPDYEAPDEADIVGSTLTTAELSSDMTKLWFGTDDNPMRTVMVLDPTTYQVSDPHYNEGDPVSPQMAAPEMTTAFESSAPGPREVEGPEETQEAPADAEPIEDE